MYFIEHTSNLLRIIDLENLKAEGLQLLFPFHLQGPHHFPRRIELNKGDPFHGEENEAVGHTI